jgi:hypothetical protein
MGKDKKAANDNGVGDGKETGKYIFIYKMKGEQSDAT